MCTSRNIRGRKFDVSQRFRKMKKKNDVVMKTSFWLDLLGLTDSPCKSEGERISIIEIVIFLSTTLITLCKWNILYANVQTSLISRSVPLTNTTTCSRAISHWRDYFSSRFRSSQVGYFPVCHAKTACGLQRKFLRGWKLRGPSLDKRSLECPPLLQNKWPFVFTLL